MASTSTRRRDDDRDEPPAHEPRATSPALLLLLFGGGLLLVVAFGGAFALYIARLSARMEAEQAVAARDGALAEARAARVRLVKPRQDKEGVEWDHKELVQYLKGRGASVDWKPAALGANGEPAVYIYTTAGQPADFNPSTRELENDPNSIYCTKELTAQAAKDYAGMAKRHTLVWGRFAFITSNDSLLDDIRRLLNG